MSTVALNPLVPAYPSVVVSMEKFIISKNKDVNEGSESSLTISNGSSTENSVNIGIDASISVGLGGFGASVSTSFSKGTSHTLSTEKTEGKNWSASIGMNTADSAYYNGNVRYYNRGTAPIYHAKPTTSLVLDHGKNAKTLFTVKAKENQEAEVIKPGDSYPKEGLAPISMRNMDDFGSTPMPLSYSQLRDIEKGTPLSLQTDQFAGDYIKVVKGDQSEPRPWTYWLTQIDSSSARIILSDGDTETERRIAARSAEDYENDTKPEVTLGEAIQSTFGIERSDTPTYNGDPIQFIFNKDTAKDIEKQLMNMGDKANLQNVKLKAGMQIMLITNLVFNGSFKYGFGDWEIRDDDYGLRHLRLFENRGPDGENVIGWDYKSTPYEVFGAVSQYLNVIPNKNYKASAWVKTNSSKSIISLEVSGHGGYNPLINGIKRPEHKTDDFEKIEFTFNSGKYNKVIFKLMLWEPYPIDTTNVQATNLECKLAP
nr:carbohydrate binding domain-containing protein [Paenibacillus larvae]